MSTPESGLAAQRRLLLLLASVEKSQTRRDILCNEIRFSGDDVILRGGEADTHRVLPLDSNYSRVHAALQSMWTAPLDSRSELSERYPSELDLAGCWAELHYDLGRTSYLDEIDPSIRYHEIGLMDGSVQISVSGASHRQGVIVNVVLDRGEAPIHVADEIGERLSHGPTP
ncbi:UNVERIFIED_CONTAM: hypothetical protein OHV15_05290 [Microbacterium sp. SLM126]